MVSSPLISTLPEVGVIRRLIIFSVVVLPQPDGPRNTQISPSLTVRLTESTAFTCCAVLLRKRLGEFVEFDHVFCTPFGVSRALQRLQQQVGEDREQADQHGADEQLHMLLG